MSILPNRLYGSETKYGFAPQINLVTSSMIKNIA